MKVVLPEGWHIGTLLLEGKEASRGSKHLFLSNPYIPENMPHWAWSNWAELRAFSDCSTDSLGDPHLGEVNVTIPNWKTKDLRYESLASSKLLWISRRAYYASVSHVDDEIGRCSENYTQM